ncbi:MAG TPA: 50S ribosomal protein L17, partial [Dehalococcoidia bacterium]|nr:50S ribosomal protein L17 [Dehalococcoidia bacterium]|tara:strand:- start:151 stop:717 length:567 start_codon:yes stop_codon:yes gene_type:complete
MRHRKAGRHLGRDSAHRKALYRNLVTDLLRYERITTTDAKAREIRPIAEKMITLGRRGDLHARRQALSYIYDRYVVDNIFNNIGPRMADRPGGYLRITRLESRKGDGARMAVIETVDYQETVDVADEALAASGAEVEEAEAVLESGEIEAEVEESEGQSAESGLEPEDTEEVGELEVEDTSGGEDEER